MAQAPHFQHEPPLGTIPATDPRETQEWFQRLPEHAQNEFRDRWIEDGERMDEAIERRNRTHKRYIVEALIIFVLAAMFTPTPLSLFVAALMGAGAGAIAARIPAGTFTYAGIGFTGYLLFWMLTPWGAVWGLPLCTAFCAIMGAIHNLQKADGSEG